jgi:hypothetical protein
MDFKILTIPLAVNKINGVFEAWFSDILSQVDKTVL